MIRTCVAVMLLFNVSLPMVQASTDPTRPQDHYADADNENNMPSATDNMVVSAVFISNSARCAIVNGQTLVLGAAIGDFQVVEIHSQGVVLQSNRIRKEILINNQFIKKDASNDF